jgi:calcium-dependent protein kinase
MKVDIWSLGVVYYQMIYGKYPFFGPTPVMIYNCIKNEKPCFDGVNISPKAKDFILRCLTVDPSKRISWSEVYKHPLIADGL